MAEISDVLLNRAHELVREHGVQHILQGHYEDGSYDAEITAMLTKYADEHGLNPANQINPENKPKAIL